MVVNIISQAGWVAGWLVVSIASRAGLVAGRFVVNLMVGTL